MLRLLDLLGTREQVFWDRHKFITLVENGRPAVMRSYRLPPPLHFLPSILGAPSLSLADGLSIVRITWLGMRMREADVLALDTVNARAFLERMGVRRRFIEWFWESTAMAILNLPLEECSAGALLRFYNILLGHVLQMGLPTVPLGDLFVPPARRLIEAAGGRILLGREAARLTHADGAVTGVELADGLRIAARHCVAAVPPQRLARLLPGDLADRVPAFARLEELVPDPYISTYLWFDRKLSRHRNWARVWSPQGLNYDSYDLSNIRPGWAERPSLIASNIIYSHRAEGMDDDALIAATLRELGEFLPQARAARVRHARVHRIPMAIPCPYPGSEHLRLPTRTPLRGLFLAGDWTRTALPACMESAVRSGWLAAEAVREAQGRPARLACEMAPPRGLTGLLRRRVPRDSPAEGTARPARRLRD